MTPSGAPANWFIFLQSTGIVVSLLLSAYATFRDVRARGRDTRARKIGNYLKLIEYHRDIWRMPLEMNGLERVYQHDVSLKDAILTYKEEQFLSFVFLHMTCSYELNRAEQVVSIDKLRYDVHELIKSPIVLIFWKRNKVYYNDDFVAFVESSISVRCAKYDGSERPKFSSS